MIIKCRTSQVKFNSNNPNSNLKCVKFIQIDDAEFKMTRENILIVAEFQSFASTSITHEPYAISLSGNVDGFKQFENSLNNPNPWNIKIFRQVDTFKIQVELQLALKPGQDFDKCDLIFKI